MSSFDEWYVTKITTYVFSSKADENLARQDFKAGMVRAAEIADSTDPYIHPTLLAAIRKEIDND